MRLIIRFLQLSIFALLLTVRLGAQTPVADSLRTVLTIERNPEKRVDILCDIAYELYDFDDSLALEFAEKALKQALALNYGKGIKRSYCYVGIGYVSKSDFPMAFRYYRLADSVKVENATELTVYNYSMMGSAYRDLSNFDSAGYYYNLALKEAMTTDDKKSIATAYKNIGLTNVIRYRNVEALEALALAQQYVDEIYDPVLQIGIWLYTGNAYANLLQYDKAKEYYLKGMALVDKISNRYQLIQCHLGLAGLALRQSNYSEALEEAFEAFEILKQYQYPPQQAEVLQRIGEIYEDLGQFEMAAKYFYETLKITEKHNLRLRTATAYSELAWVYKELGNYDLALDYVNRSQTINTAIGNQHGVSYCHNVRGLIYLLQKRHAEAIQELEKSKQIREIIGHLEGISAVIFNLSLVYEDMGQLEKALALQKQAISIEERVTNKLSQGISYNAIAKTLMRLNQFGEAEKYLRLANKAALETNSRLLLKNNFENYAEFYSNRADYKKAFEYQRKAKVLSDSIYTTSSRAKMAEMQAIYQIEQKEQQIQLLNQEKQTRENQLLLQQAQIQTQRLVIASTIFAFILISALAWNIYKSKRTIQRAHLEIKEQHEEIQTQTEELTEANRELTKLNQQLAEKQEEIQAQSEELMEANQTINEINRGLEEEVNRRTNELKQAYKELDTFFYRSSHDFRRPLTTFLGLAEVAKITVKDPAALELFERVRETAMNLDKMLVKLQSISDVGTLELYYKEVAIRELFDSVCDSYREELTHKHFLIDCTVNLTTPFTSYPVLIKVILENLVENSLQFASPVNPKLSLQVYEEGDKVVMELTDNGHGIDAAYHDKIFDMYFRASHYSKGNGLGLYIVKKAVEKLDGQISFTSQIDLGTTFKVVLPRSTKLSMISV
ncbi:MAG: tetratricopeptide repeat-containing sensor histidine kinase [Cyclobacteriaceae bacterium]|nr:tetratricopeptide repeat-containing sensor histidine kinase [Cyclobacteriaceae bacterium]